MDILEKVRCWVLGYPGWGGQSLDIDTTPPAPGCCGLFPIGEEEVFRRENVVGGCIRRYRREFLLRRVALRGENAAAWLMDFGRWARSSQPPKLGGDTIARATRGRLLTSVNTGIATYEIKLSIEYTEE